MKTLTKKTDKLSPAQQMMLDGYANEIRSLIRSTLESVVRIGQILKEVKAMLPYGEWQTWVDKEFQEDIKHDSADNWINLASLYAEYKEKYEDGFKKLSLASLYKISRSTVDVEVKETVLKLAQEDEPFSKAEVDSIIKVYRKAKLVEAGIDPTVISELGNTSFVENAKELGKFSRLSKKKQAAVAGLINSGIASTPREAIQQLSIASKPPEKLVEVQYTEIKSATYESLEAVSSGAVNIAIVEAPLRYSYVERELNILAVELDRVLRPGGLAIVTLGHKAIMYAGAQLEPLNPLHVLCLRRQPGNTRPIIGTNILSASVFAALAYKSPYRAPQTMLVDLQTIADEEPAGGLDEVVSGLEAGFIKFMTALVHSDDTILHMICSENHFNMRETIKDAAIDLKAEAFYTVG